MAPCRPSPQRLQLVPDLFSATTFSPVQSAQVRMRILRNPPTLPCPLPLAPGPRDIFMQALCAWRAIPRRRAGAMDCRTRTSACRVQPPGRCVSFGRVCAGRGGASRPGSADQRGDVCRMWEGTGLYMCGCGGRWVRGLWDGRSAGFFGCYDALLVWFLGLSVDWWSFR